MAWARIRKIRSVPAGPPFLPDPGEGQAQNQPHPLDAVPGILKISKPLLDPESFLIPTVSLNGEQDKVYSRLVRAEILPAPPCVPGEDVRIALGSDVELGLREECEQFDPGEPPVGRDHPSCPKLWRLKGGPFAVQCGGIHEAFAPRDRAGLDPSLLSLRGIGYRPGRLLRSLPGGGRTLLSPWKRSGMLRRPCAVSSGLDDPGVPSSGGVRFASERSSLALLFPEPRPADPPGIASVSADPHSPSLLAPILGLSTR